MRVLMCIRSDYNRNFGGDSVQMLRITEYLRRIGVEVEINSGDVNDFSPFDIVHLFNLTRMGETYKYYKLARYYKKNIVLSPLFWDLTPYYKYIQDYENLMLWERCNIYRKEILKGCKRIFPSSHMEEELLKSQISATANYVIIYNGVETISEDVPLYSLKERYNLDNYVLSIGRICRRKNQLTLAEVCKQLNMPLVLVGSITDKEYYEQCMKVDGTMHLEFFDSYNMYNAYRFARLHVQPSFVEITGVSSLEAASNGCPIVTTNQGSAYEYFGHKATYCDPYDRQSIYEAVKAGIKTNKDYAFKAAIRERFNIEKCARTLYENYISLIEEK